MYIVGVWILCLFGIWCLYKAVDHAIGAFYQYKYVNIVLNKLKNADDRQLFVSLRPYMDKYLQMLKAKTDAYVKDVDNLSSYRDYIKNTNNRIQK